MSKDPSSIHNKNWATLAQFPVPVKALISFIILTMAISMLGALGQIVIHDIIPTFFADPGTTGPSGMSMKAMPEIGAEADEASSSERGDLFLDAAPMTDSLPDRSPFYKSEQFVWTLKWTHIHLFGMNMIFIFMGGIAVFLEMGTKWKTLLVVLPFAGVLIDITTMWLKGYISPAFFWLHIPGGGLFGFPFFFVAVRAFWEMWWMRKNFAVS